MWPDKVVRQFTLIPPNPQEADFHGAYNKLLNFYFPPDSDYSVHPQYHKTGSEELTDFVICYEIFVKNVPVFVLELKPPSALGFISTREEVDDQMRKRLGDLVPRCPLQTFHGVSAIGTKLSFYTLDKENLDITPVQIARHPTKVSDVAPISRWNTDILEPAGETRLKAVFREVLDGCSGIIAEAEE